MEGKILSYLNFDLTVPSSYRFLERYSQIFNLDERQFVLCNYLLELALVDYKSLRYSPSNIACSAIYLSNKIYKRSECWNDILVIHAKYSENDVRPCAKDLCLLL